MLDESEDFGAQSKVNAMGKDILKRLILLVVALPVYWGFFYILCRLVTEVDPYINIYFVTGFTIGALLFYIKKTGRNRSVSPVNSSVEYLYNWLYRTFSDKGFRIEEYELIDGKRLTVFLDHPSMGRFILIGTVLLAIGIFPGIVWFAFGRDRLSFSLRQESTFLALTLESSSRYASKVWEKINLKWTIHMLDLDTPPPDLETTIEFV